MAFATDLALTTTANQQVHCDTFSIMSVWKFVSLLFSLTGFGIGGMIHSGLEFGKFFEVSGKEGCSDPILAVKPLLHLIFTFSQLYFVFMNSKVELITPSS